VGVGDKTLAEFIINLAGTGARPREGKGGAASGMECDPPWRMRARRHVCMHLFAFTRVLCVRVRLCLCVRVQRSAQWIARARTRVFVPSPVFISMYVHEPGWR